MHIGLQQIEETLHHWNSCNVIRELPGGNRALSQYERMPLIWGLLRENSQQT